VCKYRILHHRRSNKNIQNSTPCMYRKLILEQPAIVHKHVKIASETVSLPWRKKSSINTFPNYASYSSYDNVPLRIVGHHLQVQVLICIKYRWPNMSLFSFQSHTLKFLNPTIIVCPQPLQVTVVGIPRMSHPVSHLSLCKNRSSCSSNCSSSWYQG